MATTTVSAGTPPVRRLAFPHKVAYGFGLSAEGIKNNAFNVFLLFYYQQVLGLEASLCGIALFIAMLFDAIADPVVGVWSDGLRSRLGRRHPFLYASSLPLALCFLATFLPPQGLGRIGLFVWLTVFAVGTRFSMAVFVIPHQSLLPELTQDYDERTTLQTLRTVFAWLFGLFNALLGYTVFLRATDAYPQGLLNRAGYVPFAIWGASAMFVATMISSLGTQRAALAVQADLDRTRQLTLRDLPAAVREAWSSPAYRAAVLAGLCLYVGFGLGENLRNYVNTFLWGFTSEQIAVFLYVIMIASGVVLAVTGSLAARLGKRRLAIVASILPGVITPALIGLRLVGVLPGGGEPILLRVISVTVFFEYGFIIIAMTIVGSMIADITDEHEMRTGSRQEGLLFAANTFLMKAASGFGVLGASLVIEAVDFPEGASAQAVSPDVLRSLGAITALGTLLLWAGAVFFFFRYHLSRERHGEIMAELGRQRADRARESAGRH
jgi:GPH family glycoside/pentoside/hexuronide:cation symporter